MSNATTTTPVPDVPRTRNRRGEGGRLRDDIVAAAAGLLDEAGDEHAVTLRSVARRVGVAAPSIYRHFPDQPSIMLAVVRGTFAELEAALEAALAGAGTDPRNRLRALSDAYLDYASEHPGRYRTMFGGVWMPDLSQSALTENDLVSLGGPTLGMLTDTLEACVAEGVATSTDPAADAVALWLGLHGLAHQRASTVSFPWPGDIVTRLVSGLTHLDPA
ncbi:TetR/AcrR family transcriptional regulator [Microlunatus antarcticus]|uniref:AcrR family transcriptional regulator n=1 Tax=Microlunatus antarcticus TaxID=53388 RepID=A0A7W5P7J3_9ACTN|nr:TetR/AcrR family transcriptional regulator [Microlunatus antarcticus]MBB3327563.1 AcrR family transcriptional regulator [Microlunatus antarcticus]